MVQAIVVCQIDKELGGRAIPVTGAGHGNGPAAVFQAIVSLIADGGARLLLLHHLRKTASLDHETGANAMENSAIVKVVFDILEKVLNRCRSLIGVKLHNEITMRGLDEDPRRLDRERSLICPPNDRFIFLGVITGGADEKAKAAK
jgi:hypothetical protein